MCIGLLGRPQGAKLVLQDGEPQFDSYSLRRLGIRRGHRVVLFNAPAGYRESFGDLVGNRARFLHAHALGDGEKADIVIIWPATIGLFEQSLREVQDRMSPDVIVWAVLDTEGLGLRERHVSREGIVASALPLGLQDVGLKPFSPGQHALKLVPVRHPRLP